MDLKLILGAVAASLVLTGCQTVKTFGSDAVSAVKALPRPHFPVLDPPAYDADLQGVIDYCKAVKVRFEYGRDMVGNGNELLAQGRKMVSDGAYRIRRGEAKIVAAETALANARRDLGLKIEETEPTFGDYKTLLDPQMLSRIQTRLDNGLLALERGQDMVEAGEREVADGRARIDRGIDAIRTGQAAMQDDEGRCRKVPRERLS